MFALFILCWFTPPQLSDSTPDTIRRIEQVDVRISPFDRSIVPAGQKPQYTILKSDLEKTPQFLGENDLMKAIQLLPGASTTQEGGSDLQIRGGTKDQNLILLDGMPIYSNSHLFGLLSAINASVIERVDVFHGAFPSAYGGKLSSVIDVKSLNPLSNMAPKTGGMLDLGVTSGKFNLTVPILEEKVSIVLAGRRSFHDLLTQFQTNPTQETLYFYDLHGIVDFRPNPLNQFKLSTYQTQDRSVFTTRRPELEKNSIEKQQRGASLLWKYYPNENYQSDLTLHYIKYDNTIYESKPTYLNSFESRLSQLGLLWKNQQHITKQIDIQYGIEYQSSQMDPLLFSGLILNSEFNERTVPRSYQREISLFSGTTLKWKKDLLDLGLRYNSIIGWESSRSQKVEPRISYVRTLSDNFFLKVAYARMSQAIHQLAEPGLGIPIEINVPLSNIFRPQYADILSLGFNKNIYHNTGFKMTASVEGYVKRTHDLLTFKDGYDTRSLILNFNESIFHAPNLEDAIWNKGSGKAQGLELQLKVGGQYWHSHINYTLSKAENKFTQIDDGNWFPASQDRRHIFHTGFTVDFPHQWSLSTNFSYASGAPVHLPDGYYSIPDHNNSVGNSNNNIIFTYNKRNAYRMKDYHRLDVNIKKSIDWNKNKIQFNVGAYNVYNRKNPNFYYMYIDETQKPKLKSVSMFPFIPSFSVRLDF